MSVIVLVIGVVLTGLGLAVLGFALPIIELSFGATLVTVGTIALCSGLILIGLSAAISELRRVGDLLRARAMPRRVVESQPPVAAAAPAPALSAPAPPALAAMPPAAFMPPVAAAPVPPSLPPLPAPAVPQGPAAASQRPAPQPARQRPEIPVTPEPRHPEPAPLPAADVSASAIERLRTSMARTERSRAEPAAVVADEEEVPLSPNGGHAQVQARRPGSEPTLEPRLSPDDRVGGGTADSAKATRLDFLFRSRQSASSPRADQEDTNWPSGQPASRGGAEAGPQPRYTDAGRSASAQSTAPAAEPRPRDLGASAAQPAGAVLKSGVVDGMAYTLYTDGSIEANLPDGTVRFNSIADLRAHIEKHP